ncbi:hypothetical protein Q0590_26080 [Rhodocytophaga aerolata]|uniref:Uncharacterized protein n=1 Tax=Rhodocytophaga aerolata TaxID=455078 RepID=A0ABT8RAJ0_9BACT|nr:hypothetical protein [Rhodocytophaga aerolata]MDO1449116.1 hypothetical protein [Rhodocytophaga aerolata]MDO1449774.1 hypothetical protein [Rhodocytophaga aerolata]
MIKGVNLAYYEKKDWARFLEMIDDKGAMHEKWEDWYKEYQKVKKRLKEEGFAVREVKIDIDELYRYCQTRKIALDGKARSQFAQTK